MRLRAKDLDFAQRVVIVRDGKGEQDRVTMLPDSLITPLQEHLQRVKRLHDEDWQEDTALSFYPTRLIVNIGTPAANGVGNRNAFHNQQSGTTSP